MSYDASRIAAFFDDYGEREWTRFELLSRHGTVVAASAAGLLAAEPEEPELRELLARVEVEIGCESGAISCGPHILAVLRKDE